ncbi:MAG: hypothetical protein Q8880_05835, partial [Bacteroidota bacterium]|nr:hypothetical protein [Bacteroidota bacterium]
MLFSEKSFLITVADLNICIHTSEKKIKLISDNSFSNFNYNHLVSNNNPNTLTIDLDINISIGIPDIIIAPENEIFSGIIPFNYSTESYSNTTWNIYLYNNKYFIKVNFENNNDNYFYLLCLNFTDFKWNIFIPETSNNNYLVNPLKYPLGIIILYYLVILKDGFILHSSGVKYKNEGYIFSGFSGSGKSTLARLFVENGATLINDDRLIIRTKNNRYMMYNTPLYNSDNPYIFPINKLFIIKHDIINNIKQI